jgi:hypothetical protein
MLFRFPMYPYVSARDTEMMGSIYENLTNLCNRPALMIRPRLEARD